jgi:hypothetical protein
MQNKLEHELLELNDFYADAIASFPPFVRVKTRIVRGLNGDTGRMAFHRPIEHALRSSRVVSCGDKYNGPELMPIAPGRKRTGSHVGGA